MELLIFVPYEGNIEIESIDNVISYWVSFNQCDDAPIYNDVPDINLIDLCQAEHYVYENGINGSTVEFIKSLVEDTHGLEQVYQ